MRRSIGVVTHTGLPVIDGKFFVYENKIFSIIIFISSKIFGRFYNYIYSNKNMIINIVYNL